MPNITTNHAITYTNISFLPSGVVVGAGMVVGTENNEVKTN